MRPIEQQHHYGADFITEESSVDQSQEKHLAYSAEFRQFLRRHPGIVEKALKLTDRLADLKAGHSMKQGGIEVTLLHNSSKNNRPIFRVDIADEETGSRSLFVKRENDLESSQQGGYDEMLAYKEAQERLRGIEGVELIKYDLAWSYKNVGYVVADFHPGAKPSNHLENYLRLLRQQIISGQGESAKQAAAELKQLEERAKIIRHVLPDYYDASDYNMAYDPQTKKILLYDLNFRQKLRKK